MLSLSSISPCLASPLINHTADSIIKRRPFKIDTLWHKSFIDSLTRRFLYKKKNKKEEYDQIQLESIKEYVKYEGKIIKSISFAHAPVFNGLSTTTHDGKQNLKERLNNWHTNTQQSVIEKSLFFKKNEKLSSYTLADNARYIRSLPFLRDAKIYVSPCDEKGDSVEVLVLTQDVFGPGFAIYPVTHLSGVRTKFYHTNINGMGQAVEAGIEVNGERTPLTGTSLSYTKYNLLGTFTDFNFGYSQLNTQGAIDTGVYEGSFFVKLNRPLYSSNSHFAGGLSFQYNKSINVENQHDSIFRNYHYRMFDTWMAYSFNFRKFSKRGAENRSRRAISARYYQQHFLEPPDQPYLANDPTYNNWRYGLFQFIAFRQEIYNTRFLFGFGRTEDVPTGYYSTFTIGRENRLDKTRTYAGTEYERQKALGKGFSSAYIGLGGFYDKEFEDIVLSIKGSFYSRLMTFKKLHFRHLIELGYINCFNPTLYKPVSINNGSGLSGFSDDYLNGDQRITLKSELDLYNIVEVLGFRFNAFTSLQLAQLGSTNDFILAQRLYPGIGGGFRIRNENLVFNTVKIAGYYYPGAPQTSSNFNFSISTVIDLRFNVSPIKAPSFVSYK
ncbi:hypothetical protein [Solitalea lacus]|uniref:hypothetical protein n=1 Tax=Solitalea lacus TaxID=2911172 RepID=UPI001EDBCD1E|nr:hypothetical protein [Solitalea lacus]UKJ08685.1 hypothetical protein L2B55_05830 [Solitalea lacus]